MILFTLRCANGHEFEGWFRDGDGFETQQKAGEIACPECSDDLGRKGGNGPTSRPFSAKPCRRCLRRSSARRWSRCAGKSRPIAITSVTVLPRRLAASIMARSMPHSIYGEASEDESRELAG